MRLGARIQVCTIDPQQTKKAMAKASGTKYIHAEEIERGNGCGREIHAVGGREDFPPSICSYCDRFRPWPARPMEPFGMCNVASSLPPSLLNRTHIGYEWMLLYWMSLLLPIPMLPIVATVKSSSGTRASLAITCSKNKVLQAPLPCPALNPSCRGCPHEFVTDLVRLRKVPRLHCCHKLTQIVLHRP